MNCKFIIIAILLITPISCTSKPNSNQTQSLLNNTLQITYIQLKEDQNLSELYTIDVTCISDDKICIDKPQLLYQSLKVPNNEQAAPKGFITDYSWSPDGSKIALISSGDIFIGNINHGKWANITNTHEAEHKPNWSSDGKYIYYITCAEDAYGACTPQLFRFELSNMEKLKLLDAWGKFITMHYAISPDGKKVIFGISGPLAISDLLYQSKWDGADSHQLTTENVSENDPSFSPDGQKIVFVRSTIHYDTNSKEGSDIVLKSLASGAETNLTENFDNEVFSPKFSPDGRWILFEAFDQDLGVNVYLISLEKRNVIQVTTDNQSGFPNWRILTEQSK